MVTVLVVIIALGVLQLALAQHVRHTLTSCASAGARVAAVDTDAAGIARARECADQSLGLEAEGSAAPESVGDLAAVRITLEAQPHPFSLWRPDRIEASGRALVEGAAR